MPIARGRQGGDNIGFQRVDYVIYVPEIRELLASKGLSPELVAV